MAISKEEQTGYIERLQAMPPGAARQALMYEFFKQLKPLTYTLLRRYFSICEEQGRSMPDKDDLSQSAYIALNNAVDTYDNSGGGVSFSVWYAYAISNETRAARGISSRDAIFKAKVLSTPLDDGGENGATLFDIVADEDAAEDFESVDRAEWRRELRGVLDEIGQTELTEQQRQIINSRYYNKQSRAEIAQQLGITPAAVCRDEYAALRQYRKWHSVQKLKPFIFIGYSTSLKAFRDRGASSVELEVEAQDSVARREKLRAERSKPLDSDGTP